MGGDLIDLIETDGSLLAYVAIFQDTGSPLAKSWGC
jgi:hypothetical protein